MLPEIGTVTKSTSALRWIRCLPWVILPILLGSLALVLILGGLASAAPVDLPQTVAFDQTVAAVISQVATSTLEYELAGLTGQRPVTVAGSIYTITSRYSRNTDEISMATRYAYEQFAGYGLVVTYHNYSWSGYPLRNVVAEKLGLVGPDEIYLITAHVDDLPAGPLAPGADDNGSGSVAVLTAARLLAPHDFAHTLRFVLFTGEEQGLRGSAAYAAECAARGENIEGVVNLDMIGYNTGEPGFDAYARSGSQAGAPESRRLADVFSNVVGIYDLNLVPQRIDSDSYPLRHGSDQWSFLEHGYPAFLVIEDMDDFTPYYHSVSDTLATLDLEYYADFTRAAVATFAHLGRLMPSGHLSGTIYASDTGRAISATVGAQAPRCHYTFTAVTDVDGEYFLSFPVGNYTLTVRPNLPGYYPATITDVLVVTDTVTVLDVPLAPWTRAYLPWIARER